MKKILLLALAVSVGVGMNAQNGKFKVTSSAKQVKKTINAQGEQVSAEKATTAKFVPFKKQTPITNFAISTAVIGNSSNCYGSAFGAKTALAVQPQLNMVTMIYRNDPAVTTYGGGSGHFNYGSSVDGGNTWAINQGPIYDPTAAGTASGRYPQMNIYNPQGNTDPNNAYATYFGATLAGTNGANWGGLPFGSKMQGGTTSTSNEVTTAITQVPVDFVMTQTGNIFGIDIAVDAVTVLDYIDQIVLAKGVWNGTNDYAYTISTVDAPMAVDADGGKRVIEARTGFAPNGLTGYISVTGHQSFTCVADSANFPSILKTTDGGATWVPTTNILLDNIDQILNNGTTQYTTAFEQDMVVDINGNAHIIVGIGPSTNSWSIGNNPGTWGMSDIYTTDGGTTWKAQLLGKPSTFRGNFGATPLTEDSRPQAATTWAGDKVFFGWFDTDTITFPTAGGDNIFPDFHCAALDVNTGLWAAEPNKTVGSSAEGILIFGNMGNYVLGSSGTYTVPVSYLEMTDPADDTKAAIHNYVSGIEVTDAEFTAASSAVTLTTCAFTIGLNEVAGSANFSVGQNVPNPFTGNTQFVVTLKNTSDVTVEVSNLVGQVVSTNTYTNLNTGANTITIDGSKLGAGSYYYTVKVGDNKVTRKMIVQ
nr:T9SS type A sorting domain-containing protein [Bacteroidota bacterium]